jgi:hypothetical protein
MRLAIVFGLGIVAVPAGLGAVLIVHPTGSSWIVETLVVVAAAALLGGVGAGFSVGRGSILIGWLVMLAGLALGLGSLAILGHPTDTLLWLAGVLMSIGFTAGRGLWWLGPPAGTSTSRPAGTRGRGRFWDGTGWD